MTLHFFRQLCAAVPPPARVFPINAFKTLYLLQYIIVFSPSILVNAVALRSSNAVALWWSYLVEQWSNLVKAVKNGQIYLLAASPRFWPTRPASGEEGSLDDVRRSEHSFTLPVVTQGTRMGVCRPTGLSRVTQT